MVNSNFNIKKIDRGLSAVIIILIIYTIYFAIVNIMKFRIFSTTTFGWMHFYAYENLMRFRSPAELYVFPEFSVVQYSFAPLGFIFAFIYSFFHNPEIFLFFQSLIMALGSIPVYLLTKKILQSTYLAFVFAVSYLLNPLVTTAAMLGYLPNSFGFILLLYSFYFFEKNDIKKFCLFMVLASLSKIDVVIMFILFGLILYKNTDKREYGKIIIKVTIILLVLMTSLCLISLKLLNRNFPVAMLHMDKYGNGVTDVIQHVLSSPVSILANLFNFKNMLFYDFFSLPNIFSFFSPVYLLAVIPESFFILVRNEHSTGHLLILPFVFYAAILGFKKIIGFIARVNARDGNISRRRFILPYIIGSFILFYSLAQHYYFKPVSGFGEGLGPIPFKKGFNFKSYLPTRHTESGNKLIKMIPEGSSCLVLRSLATHLSKCGFVASVDRFSLSVNYNWDYIFVDMLNSDFYNLTKDYFLTQLKKYMSKWEYGVLAFEDGWLLLKRGYVKDKNLNVISFIDRIIANEKK